MRFDTGLRIIQKVESQNRNVDVVFFLTKALTLATDSDQNL